MSIRRITIILDGETLTFANQKPCFMVGADNTGAPIYGTSVAPIRVIFEKMGYTVVWRERSIYYTLEDERVVYGSLTMTNGKYTVYIRENLHQFTTNGVVHTFPDNFCSMVVGTDVVVPVRSILESVGCKVEWDQDSYTVSVTSESNLFTVTFVGNGGTVEPTSITEKKGENITLPLPTRTGYEFIGWYTNMSGRTKVGNAGDNFSVESDSPTLEVQLFAMWRELTASEMINNFENSDCLSNNILKKNALVAMGYTLIQEDYEPAFIAGILGYIQGEGDIGKFESSNYVLNPKPWYLEYVDTHYNYNSLYSNKHIYDDGINLNYVKTMLEELESMPKITKIVNGKEVQVHQGGFGLGCCQWTFTRTLILLDLYLNQTNGNSQISYTQAAAAEADMVIYELTGSYNTKFNNLYNNWKNLCQTQNIDFNSAEAAFQAGYIVLFVYGMYSSDYSNPDSAFVDIATERGTYASAIYNAMV